MGEVPTTNNALHGPVGQIHAAKSPATSRTSPNRLLSAPLRLLRLWNLKIGLLGPRGCPDSPAGGMAMRDGARGNRSNDPRYRLKDLCMRQLASFVAGAGRGEGAR